MKRPLQISKSTDIKYIFIFTVLLSIFLVIGGYLYYQSEANRLKEAEYIKLKSIANEKNAQISQWMKERLADAKHFSTSSLYAKALEKWLATEDTALGNEIKQRNRMIKDLRGFESVFIVSRDKKRYLKFDTLYHERDSLLSHYIDSSFLNKKIYFTDFYYYQNKNKIHLAIVSPIVDKKKNVISSLVFIIDLNTYFFPLIQSWPTPSKTSEIVLVRREKDFAVVMNELRHAKKTALNYQISINRTDKPIVQAALGKTGFFEGKDYREIEVLADVLKVKGTNWYMLTKVDKSEIFAELRFREIVVIIIVLVLIILIGLLFGWYYLYKKNSFYRTLLINEKRIHKMEEEYRITLYSVGDGVIYIDNNGHIKKMNREAEMLTGWKEKESQGMPLEKVFNIIYEKATKQTIPTDNINTQELPIGILNKTSILVSRDGKKIPIDGSSSPIQNDQGEITGVVIIFKDQSKERASQNALTESEARLKRAESISKSGNWELDFNKNIMYGSQGAMDIYELNDYSWNLSEVQKIPLPEYRDKLNTSLKNLIENGELYDIEFKIKTAISGKIIDIQSKASYDKESNKVFGIIRDITDFKNQEELLREKELIFQSLMDNSPIYMFFKDHEIRAIYLSKNYEKMLGMPISGAIGKTMDDLFPSDLAKSMIEDDKKIIQEGKLVQVDEELNGRYYTTIKFPINREGYPPMLAGFTLDITDRKIAEKELIQARDLAERSDRLKDAFLQNMSHEIRTPMNAIIGFSDLLQNDNLSQDKLVNYTSIIVNSSNQLLAIVDDILTVSRIQTGHEVINNTNIDIYSLIENITSLYKPKAEGKKLTFITTILLENKPYQINTDGTKLFQIITNLLNNALKFTHEGNIEISVTESGKYLEFCVKDTGIGIKQDMQSIIFERFIQADNSISKKYGGTGLGLSICKAYSTLLGGNIWVVSEPGVGSEFHFTITLNKTFQNIQKENPIKKVNLPQNKIILVAEDEQFNYQLIKEILYDQYSLLLAHNGKEAIELFETHPDIDLILMDIKMPEIDGQTAMKEIKKRNPEIPIIAQTAYALENEKEEFMKSGFDDYITKPINKSELISKVAKYLK